MAKFLRSRRRVIVATLISLLGVSVIGSIALLAVVVQVPAFRAQLVELSQGHWVVKGSLTGPYVLLRLTYTSPSALQAARLAIHIAGPNLPNLSFPGPNGTIMVRSVDLSYYGNDYPPWLAALPGGFVSTAYSGMMTNPDGSIVAGFLPDGESGSLSSSIVWGAVLNLTYPGGSIAVGAVVTLTYQGSSGVAQVLVS